MSVNIVLPPLSAWAASRLTSILESKTQKDFDTAFDATFAAQCNITVNGKPLSRDEYKAQLLEQSAAAPLENGTVVNIEGQTEVEVGNQGQLSGIVGIFYTALSDTKYLVLGAPAESKATSSLNLAIEPTEKRPPNPLHIRGFFDPRMVVTVNQVVAESTYHVTLPATSIPAATTAPSSSTGKVELGPGPVQLPPNYTTKLRYLSGGGGLGTVRLPPTETGAKPETLPGDGEFGVGPVITSGESLGETKY